VDRRKILEDHHPCSISPSPISSASWLPLCDFGPFELLAKVAAAVKISSPGSPPWRSGRPGQSKGLQLGPLRPAESHTPARPVDAWPGPRSAWAATPAAQADGQSESPLLGLPSGCSIRPVS